MLNNNKKKNQFKIVNANLMSTAKYSASRTFLSGKSFSMYEVVRVSGISGSCLVSLGDAKQANYAKHQRRERLRTC